MAGADALVLNFWQSWVAQAPALAGGRKSMRGIAAELDQIAGELSAERTAAGVERGSAARSS